MAVWDRSTPTGIVEGFDASDQNGKRAQPHGLEIANSVAATIYSVWRNQIVNQTLSTTLSRKSLMITSPRDIQLTAVKNVFDNFTKRSGVGISGIDFFEVPGVARAADRRDIVLLRSLSNALDLLASPGLRRCFQWLHRPIRLSLGTPASNGVGASARRDVQHSARGWRLAAAAAESAGNSYRWRAAYGGSGQPSDQPATIPTASCSPVAPRCAMWPASSPTASNRCRACLAVKAAFRVVSST